MFSRLIIWAPKKYIVEKANGFEERIKEWEIQGNPYTTFPINISFATKITGKIINFDIGLVKYFNIKKESPKYKEQ